MPKQQNQSKKGCLRASQEISLIFVTIETLLIAFGLVFPVENDLIFFVGYFFIKVNTKTEHFEIVSAAISRWG